MVDFHYYTTINRDGHFTFTAADIGVRHEWKVTVNRGLTVAGACARCGKQKKPGQARRAHPEARRAHPGNPSAAGS